MYRYSVVYIMVAVCTQVGWYKRAVANIPVRESDLSHAHRPIRYCTAGKVVDRYTHIYAQSSFNELVNILTVYIINTRGAHFSSGL